MLDICKQCPLYGHWGGLDCYVPPTENIDRHYALIGEAPGVREAELGQPFVGDFGKEHDQYLANAGLSRWVFHIRNIVQCRPPGNRDPKPAEIEVCSQFLNTYLETHRPKVIGAIGRFSARWFLGEDLSMEYSHGIPYQVEGVGPIVVPIYHPAAGLRSTSMMTLIRQDYEALGRVIRGEIPPRRLTREITRVNALDFAHFPLEAPEVVAVDTETNPDGSAWCLTYCLDSARYASRIIMADDHDNLKKFNEMVNRPGVITIVHNALFDLGVLESIGVKPAIVQDTMVMAYLLQDLPLGLKPLSYRLLNMNMHKYTDMIHDKQQDLAIEYLTNALLLDYPDPDQVIEWRGGFPKLKQPQNIGRKIQRLLKKVGTDADIADAWAKMDYNGGRSQVEDIFGPMPQASLRDIDFGAALQYACADAAATYKIYPILKSRITEMDLWDTFNRDMRMIPLVARMMREGVLVDQEHLQKLDRDYEILKQNVEADINAMFGSDAWLNPGSPKQVAEALYLLGVVPTKNHSTDVKAFDLLRDKHPIINKITRWRELGKLQSTYLKPLPERADSSGRIHTKYSVTRTTTGRLASSKPNLQNIPTRSEEGKQIRYGFIANPGCKLLANDYSQIEMRCTAHMANDRTMIKMFLDDLDIHSETAARMFKIPVSDVDKNKHRRPAKSIGFGVIYCMSALGLQDQMLSNGIVYSERECQDLIAAWYGVFPDIYNYMDQVKALARKDGLVRDYFGRYRLVPEVYSAIPRIVNAGLRQASNAPIQSMAQQIIKQAMGDLIPIYEELSEGGRYICRPLIQIHDEIISEVSEEIVDYAAVVIQSAMENAVELCVPTPVDCNIGNNWGELK